MSIAAPEFLARLTAIAGAERVIADAAVAAPWLSDWRGRYHGRALAVVFPACTAEVAAIARLCSEQRIAMVPQGGNTGLCGGATPLPDGQALLVNLSRLRQVRNVDPVNNTMVVEAGVTLAEVQAAALAADRLFPVSLASEGSCQIGGNLSTNAGGVQVLRYGNTREQVLGVEVVLADGRVWDGLRGLRKDNTGYDLKQLFIGAEGTLGFITAAVLKLHPRPRAQATAWLAVPTPDAALALREVLQQRCGERLTAFEIVSAVALGLVVQHIPGARPPALGASAPWFVLVELTDAGADAELMPLLQAALEDALGHGVALDGVVAASVAQAQALWALRENISEAQKREGFSIKHDVAVPLSRIPAFLEEAGRRLQARWPDVRVVAFGHIGDGNLHYNLSKPAAQDNEAFIAQSGEVNRIVHDLVASLGGSISAEHGLGQLKREEILRYKSPVEMEMMRAVKRALDPLGLMNPGKLL